MIHEPDLIYELIAYSEWLDADQGVLRSRFPNGDDDPRTHEELAKAFLERNQ